MNGNINIITCILIILMANSIRSTKGASFRKTQTISRNIEDRIPESRDHSALYEEYYQDSGGPANYDLDYYPYKSYAYENEQEPFEEHHAIEKKHKTKRRGSKEKLFSDKDSTSKINHLNSQKLKIKSQKKSKSNLKTKTRRYALKDVGFNENKEDNFSLEENNRVLQREGYLPPANPVVYLDPSVYSLRTQQNNVYNANNSEKKTLSNPEILEGVYNMDRYKTSKKISPYEYLHIHNRSHHDLKALPERVNVRYAFSPNDFGLRSLSEALNEPSESRKTRFPQCPAFHFSSQDNAQLNEEQSKVEFLKEKNQRKMNYNDPIKWDNYFGKNQERRNEEYEDKSVRHDMRAKREPKVKTFTLSFPAVGNVLSLKDFPYDPLNRKGKDSNIGNSQNGQGLLTMCTSSTTPAQCTTLPLCTTLCTSATTLPLCTTEEECTTPPKCTTVEQCTTSTEYVTTEDDSEKCTRFTTCQTNFKELNEGNKILMDISNYVSNMFHPNVGNATSGNTNNKRQRVMIINEKNTPVSLKTKYDVIKLMQPHYLVQRSNEVPNELNNNIYIVKLLKDLSSVGQLTEIPLQSEKSFFSVPYAPRLRRQLAIMNKKRVPENVYNLKKYK